MESSISVVGVASPYAWDIVESARRRGIEVHCVDNFGDADPLLPNLSGLNSQTDRSIPFVIGLSSAAGRANAAMAAFTEGFGNPVALVDPSCSVASTSTVRHGAYINAGSVVASNTVIGCHANINRSSSIGHDNQIGFASSIAPGAVLTGGISVEATATVGAGAIILPRIVVGRGAIVGAGAVVTKDVPEYAVVVGSPARIIQILPRLEGPRTCPHC
ncbi:hypothetical protein [Salinibacterium sp.]|uniref:hypothetical protein n=1 Tax=Salinibacterium sp. TaxID=1915057 RepID=UPI00286C78B6|nr:hypothetical protein [Salinibacterium sp.]